LANSAGRLLVIQPGRILPPHHSVPKSSRQRSELSLRSLPTICLHLPSWYPRCRPRPRFRSIAHSRTKVVTCRVGHLTRSRNGYVHSSQQHRRLRRTECVCLHHADSKFYQISCFCRWCLLS
jgi:hypothetical protein